MKLSSLPFLRIKLAEEAVNVLEVSSGVQRDTSGVWVPLPPWREVPELVNRMRTNDRADIELFSLPDSVWKNFRDCEDIEKLAPPVAELIFNYLRTKRHLCGKAFIVCSDPKIGANPPGCATTTIGSQGQRIGLHLDTWGEEDTASREASPQRLCVNLGTGDRHFLFVPVAIRYLLDSPKSSSRGFEDRFFRDHPDCPIVRLQMKPGTGYIAPTDTIIHDGSTEAMNVPDVYLAARLTVGPLNE